MKRLFFSQSMLDSMAEAGRIKVDRNIMTMLAGGNPAFALVPACRIVRTIGDAPDAAGLVSQIRSEAELRQMGAEVYMDSVICRDVAYQVDPGFIAEQQTAGEKNDTPPAEAVSPQPPAEPPSNMAKDGDELTRFILDTLR